MNNLPEILDDTQNDLSAVVREQLRLFLEELKAQQLRLKKTR
ncbi:hypothetical protein RS130_18355 [Paraglaciecola aquimarina]|uniref:Transposase n=1 Tax=Paraglaciecola aquimarina TaxID=1235557 RepID=A0ABU3T016_9ALTE|nr:hypothetical protein [Paraglaciecola aquimarina]MDU0355599.1 hypothetical protein [Paraglaciecola aquimarina]